MEGKPKKTQPRILVVDDDAAIASLVAQVLTEEGMVPRACHSALEALEACKHDGFDLAILDIMMPDMDGFELSAHLRQASDIPVVFLTAKDAEGDVVLGFALGAADYIVKPFKPRELVTGAGAVAASAGCECESLGRARYRGRPSSA